MYGDRGAVREVQTSVQERDEVGECVEGSDGDGGVLEVEEFGEGKDVVLEKYDGEDGFENFVILKWDDYGWCLTGIVL